MFICSGCRSASHRICKLWRETQRFFGVSRSPQSSLDVCQEYAWITVLAVATSSCAAEPGYLSIVHRKWTRQGYLAGQVGCHQGIAENVEETHTDPDPTNCHSS